jgi:RNA polymerase sigma-70 factor, ECF subfamily
MVHAEMLLTDRLRVPELDAVAETGLVARAVRGEAGAFGRLYQAHVQTVYDYVHFRVRDSATAEDLTQDVFMSAFHSVGSLRDLDRFRGWLLRIAHNRVANHWRDRARDVGLDAGSGEECGSGEDAGPGSSALPDRSACPLEAVETRLTADAVLAASEHLTDLQRQVIALRFVAGLSVAETGEAMGRSENAVKNLQHHALAALRRHAAGGGARP